MDARTPLEKWLWKNIGAPLYYCSECMKQVDVKTIDGEVLVKRFCTHDDAEIIAPRNGILSGEGFAGLSMANKAKVIARQGAAKLTGRCV